MQFLADESCDFAVVRALRVAGHDVLVAAEILPRAEDQDVLRMALDEGRILLTEDKDFGQLVFSSASPRLASSSSAFQLAPGQASRKHAQISCAMKGIG
jgi:predicted nuclease of predicted toxin-antitoxin system